MTYKHLLVNFVCPLLASSPLPTNDPWGAPAAPSDASAKADPFGDGGNSDAWGDPAESKTN